MVAFDGGIMIILLSTDLSLVTCGDDHALCLGEHSLEHDWVVKIVQHQPFLLKWFPMTTKRRTIETED